MSAPGIETSGLTRIYRSRTGTFRRRSSETTALEDVSLFVEAGSVHGMLGPNGAGKTTLCKILSTVLLPTSGTARVMGHDVVTATDAVRRSIGIVFGGDRGLYGRLDSRQNLRFWAAMHDLTGTAAERRIDEVLERVGLDARHERVETFSRGMKQRLHLARGLLSQPSVLLLDEPTTGMDPAAAHAFRQLVLDLRAEGRTVLITTHDLVEAEAICDQVTLFDHGRVLATQAPRQLGRLRRQHERVEIAGADAALVAQLRDLPGVERVEQQEGSRCLVETGDDGAAASVLRCCADAGITTVRSGPPSLEDVYLEIVGDRGMDVS